MIDAWRVVREDKHVDPEYVICLEREDALALAHAKADWYTEDGSLQMDDTDFKCYGEEIYAARDEVCDVKISVMPMKIREKGETECR